MTLETEGEAERARRRYQRGLSGSAAALGGRAGAGLPRQAPVTLARAGGVVAGG